MKNEEEINILIEKFDNNFIKKGILVQERKNYILHEMAKTLKVSMAMVPTWLNPQGDYYRNLINIWFDK